MKNIFPVSLLAILLSACVSLQNENLMSLQPGMYRAYLQRPDGMSIVFNFELTDSAGQKTIYIINGKEHLRVDSIAENRRHFTITMPFFDTEFKGRALNDGSLQGRWIRHLADADMVIPFRAIPGKSRRFDAHHQPSVNITGRWAAHFISNNKNDTSFSVGEFVQHGDTLSGTFLNTDGDDRYLQGIVDGDSIKLSTFDGSHAYLFLGAVSADENNMSGKFYSGQKGLETWVAVKNDTAHLPDAFSLTTVKPGEEHLDFTFPNLDSDLVSLHDFYGKVTVVQIMGSWCPNCMDETAFLSNYYNQNKNRGIAVIGLAYERTTDFHRSRNSVMEFKNRFNVQYPLLVTGVTENDPQIMQKTLPQIQHFQAFPTTIFIDKKGNIRKIHTGFSGPGTGEHYQEFKKEFNQVLDSLLAL